MITNLLYQYFNKEIYFTQKKILNLNFEIVFPKTIKHAFYKKYIIYMFNKSEIFNE